MKVNGTDLFMIRGDSEVINIHCVTAEGQEVPLEEGDTIHFTVKDNIHEEEVLLQKIVTNFAEGTANIMIAPTDTKSLLFGTYVYDVQLTTSHGFVTTVVPVSKFTLGGEVTCD